MTDWRILESELAAAKAAAIEAALALLDGILPFLTTPTSQQVRITQARLRDERNGLLADSNRRDA